MTDIIESSVYETAPWGYSEQPSFLNMVVAGTTLASPRLLLSGIKEIEQALGRQPTFRWGPRVIDIDILLYGDQCVEIPGLLTVPHTQLENRGFVRIPLCEIAPTTSLPTGRQICCFDRRALLEEQSVRLLGKLP